MEFEYTNAELDFILERFDKSGPKMQRQIVARLMSENAMNAGKNSLFDEMREACAASLKIIADAIMHGMPISKEVADTRNQLCSLLSRIDALEPKTPREKTP